MSDLFQHPQLILLDPEVFVNGHFVGAGGEHLRFYFNTKAILTRASRLTNLMMHVNDYFFRIGDFDVVASADPDAAVPSFELARTLEFYTQRSIAHVVIGKGPQGSVIDSVGKRLVRNRNVLIFADVIQSGGAFIRAARAIKEAGGHVLYGACLCDRNGKTKEELGVKDFFPVLTPSLEIWQPRRCDLCDAGVPINTELGHGAEYVAKHGQPKAA